MSAKQTPYDVYRCIWFLGLLEPEWNRLDGIFPVEWCNEMVSAGYAVTRPYDKKRVEYKLTRKALALLDGKVDQS